MTGLAGQAGHCGAADVLDPQGERAEHAGGSRQHHHQRALRMLEESLDDHETEYAVIRHVASRLGIGPESLRRWRHRSGVDSGAWPG